MTDKEILELKLKIHKLYNERNRLSVELHELQKQIATLELTKDEYGLYVLDAAYQDHRKDVIAGQQTNFVI